MTQFPRPPLLSSFYDLCHSGCLLSPTSGCPCLPTKQTLTVTHFLPPLDSYFQSTSPFPHSCLPDSILNSRKATAERRERCLVIGIDHPWRMRSRCDGGNTGMDGRMTNMLQVSKRGDVWGQLCPTGDDFRRCSVEATKTLLLLLLSHPTAFRRGLMQNPWEWFEFIWMVYLLNASPGCS